MEINQSLDKLSARILLSVGEALDRIRPDRVVVQGDTATAMIGALAAYYRRIPVSHVEAGLRSGNIYAPWPEEVNRKIVGSIADQHFAPTELAAEVLRKENVPSERVHVTGNTIVDALLATRELIDSDPALACRWGDLKKRQGDRQIILVTTHRRENFGDGMDRIADALLHILRREDVAIVLPMHLNPNVRDVLGTRLAGHPRAEIIEPQTYADFVGLLSLAHIVLTDFGGVQEEAPSLGKPVLGHARHDRAAGRGSRRYRASGGNRPRSNRRGNVFCCSTIPTTIWQCPAPTTRLATAMRASEL